ncbi:Dyp-type peroxidase [Streptomyces sp. NPDC048172]|uniref:Dyp-type peroxidase n=1 Tax=Streptomyces sp. NPDC048172 TaxID=3365505 RepID=UPI003720F1C5
MTSRLPLRASEQIQGNILAGFNKDHVSLLFVRFTDVAKARAWLKGLIPQVATTAAVTQFNEKFSAARRNAGGADPEKLKATWIGLSLTHPGIQFLTEREEIFPEITPGSTVDAFVQGAAQRAPVLGDVDENAPDHWLFGKDDDDKVVHAVLTVASDTDLKAAVSGQTEAISRAGAVLLYVQEAETLPGERAGKEHFGFKDGISQPGVAGFDEPDPDNPRYAKGKPGTRIIPAGEFVVGYDRAVAPEGFHRIYPVVENPPAWMKDGSFHVVRRLAQDVPGWWAQVGALLKQLKEEEAVGEEATPEWLAARFVGRWQSGTSVAKCPMMPPGETEVVPDNEFSFRDDLDGRTTPLFSHIRACNPRDGFNEGAGEEAQPEELIDIGRIMRRGIPYGEPFDPAGGKGGGVNASRGLVFGCYQADLMNQFEFMQKDWCTDPNFPPGRDPQPGPDAMIGGELTGITDGRVAFHHEAAPAPTVLRLRQFVRTEGAVYAFAPSLDTLRLLSEGRLEGEVPGRPRQPSKSQSAVSSVTGSLGL